MLTPFFPELLGLEDGEDEVEDGDSEADEELEESVMASMEVDGDDDELDEPVSPSELVKSESSSTVYLETV